MSTATPPLLEQPPEAPVYRFSVEDYHRLGETGILTPADRVELLEGWIVPKTVHNPPHDTALSLVIGQLRPLLPDGWYDRLQMPITTSESEPEPDIAIVRGSPRDYSDRHPAPAEVGLLIEVADSTLGLDRGTKARLYARAGIEEYWIVNVVDRQVEVHSDPTGPAPDPAFQASHSFRPGEEIPFRLAGTELARIAVQDLLP